jgi:SnoaL-like domain
VCLSATQCADSHNHPRLFLNHAPRGQARRQKVRPCVARNRQGELLEIEFNHRDTQNLCIRKSEDAIVAKFVSAYESADLDALVALLTDDVFISMPPMPFEYEGRDIVARFCAGIFDSGRRVDLVRTKANGQPAFGAYMHSPSGICHGECLMVLTLTGDRISALTRFESNVLPSFGLPPSLPSR